MESKDNTDQKTTTVADKVEKLDSTSGPDQRTGNLQTGTSVTGNLDANTPSACPEPAGSLTDPIKPGVSCGPFEASKPPTGHFQNIAPLTGNYENTATLIQMCDIKEPANVFFETSTNATESFEETAYMADPSDANAYNAHQIETETLLADPLKPSAQSTDPLKTSAYSIEPFENSASSIAALKTNAPSTAPHETCTPSIGPPTSSSPSTGPSTFSLETSATSTDPLETSALPIDPLLIRVPSPVQSSYQPETLEGSAALADPLIHPLKSDCILIVGQTGNGKSSLGNILLGGKERYFQVGGGMISKTVEPTVKTKVVLGREVKVIDSPDISNLRLSDDQKQKMISMLKSLSKPAPTAIVLAIKCDVIYTHGENKVYNEFKKLWGDTTDLKSKLSVVFTFGDRQIGDLAEHLKFVDLPLTNVLKDAGNRFALINNMMKSNDPESETQLKKFYELVDTLGNEPHRVVLETSDRKPSEPPKDTADDDADIADVDDMSILIIGKTGNGKSSLGNTILGTKTFPEGRGMFTVTKETKAGTGIVSERHLKVMDTPDISTLCKEDKIRIINEWKQMTASSYWQAILMTVRCDNRYTPEEYAIYLEIKRLWNNDRDFCDSLIVAFTFGDMQDEDLDKELKSSLYKELQGVLQDSSNTYCIFNKKARKEEKQRAVCELLERIRTKKRTTKHK